MAHDPRLEAEGKDGFFVNDSNREVTDRDDVRTAPYSRHWPQFNREELAHSLKAAGITYVYLGRELGGKPGPLLVAGSPICSQIATDSPSFISFAR